MRKEEMQYVEILVNQMQTSTSLFLYQFPLVIPNGLGYL